MELLICPLTPLIGQGVPFHFLQGIAHRVQLRFGAPNGRQGSSSRFNDLPQIVKTFKQILRRLRLEYPR